jgi:Xaa-Pro dipeptidase
VHQEQRRRAQELLRVRDVEQALFAHPCSVKWLTGFAPPVETGPYPFAGGPPLVWYEDAHFTLIVVDGHLPFAAPCAEADCSVVSYSGYSATQPIAGAENLAAVWRGLVGRLGRSPRRIGLEGSDVPANIAGLWEQALSPDADVVPIDGWLEPLRMVKTPDEIRKLRASLALTGVGHAAARAAVQVGRREIDVWNAAHGAMQAAAGRRVPSGEDCLVGRRENNLSGWPLDHEIRAGDSFIVDLAPILEGYWGDSCGTYYPGEPTAKQVAMHRAVAEALELGASLLRPGAVARDVDAQVKAFMARFGFPVFTTHTGHGIGVSVHEAPRLVPYNDETLQADMVIMLEPGIYLPGESSVRLEDAFLITSGGAELLTHHDKSLP